MGVWTYPHLDLGETSFPDGVVVRRSAVRLTLAHGAAEVRGVLGSTAAEVVSHAHCPVAVVR